MGMFLNTLASGKTLNSVESFGLSSTLTKMSEISFGSVVDLTAILQHRRDAQMNSLTGGERVE